MKFSIILPVKNGGSYVKECVQSILAQTYTDFNLHILENSSTDGTAEWLKTLDDERIVIIPAEKSLSIEDNWKRILSIEKNEFMTMTGHDDLLDKNYLQTMTDLIQQHPGAALYQTHFRYIDKDGKLIRQCRPMDKKQNADEFLSTFLQNNIDINGTGFMMRSEDYDKLGGIPDYPNLLFADSELWFLLTELSYKITSPEACFSYRLHQNTTASTADIKFQNAFERYILFLQKLQAKNSIYSNIIKKYAPDFLMFWCKGLAHRLMRTPVEKRNGLSVNYMLAHFKLYATQLQLDNLNYKNNLSTRLAHFIDKYSITRKLFLAFKKVYSKPLLK